jgi:hypothetical protein
MKILFIFMLFNVVANAQMIPWRPDGEEVSSGEKYMAVSTCLRKIISNGKEFKMTIGVSTFDLEKSKCDEVGRYKSNAMSERSPWKCYRNDIKETGTHHCEKITVDLENLLERVRRRQPLQNTYLVFTDVNGNMTQISFWDKPIAKELCQAFLKNIEASGMQDAKCINGH